MKFKPVTTRYDYSQEPLQELIPFYLEDPVREWILEVLDHSSLLFDHGDFYTPRSVRPELVSRLNILFRESFPSEFKLFLSYLFEDNDRLINFLAFCLQNIAYLNHMKKLEKILADGGSAWSVISSIENPQSHHQGQYNLVQRVPGIVQNVSTEAINENGLLKEAWLYCYSRNPDYEKTVSRSVDVLEGIIKKKYFPNNSKPVLSYFVGEFLKTPEKLDFRGANLVSPKNLITDILKNFIQVRGQHTNGTGRVPTKEEAEFILHYTIFFWNMHR